MPRFSRSDRHGSRSSTSSDSSDSRTPSPYIEKKRSDKSSVSAKRSTSRDRKRSKSPRHRSRSPRYRSGHRRSRSRSRSRHRNRRSLSRSRRRSPPRRYSPPRRFPRRDFRRSPHRRRSPSPRRSRRSRSPRRRSESDRRRSRSGGQHRSRSRSKSRSKSAHRDNNKPVSVAGSQNQPSNQQNLPGADAPGEPGKDSNYMGMPGSESMKIPGLDVSPYIERLPEQEIEKPTIQEAESTVNIPQREMAMESEQNIPAVQHNQDVALSNRPRSHSRSPAREEQSRRDTRKPRSRSLGSRSPVRRIASRSTDRRDTQRPRSRSQERSRELHRHSPNRPRSNPYASERNRDTRDERVRSDRYERRNEHVRPAAQDRDERMEQRRQGGRDYQRRDDVERRSQNDLPMDQDDRHLYDQSRSAPPIIYAEASQLSVEDIVCAEKGVVHRPINDRIVPHNDGRPFKPKENISIDIKRSIAGNEPVIHHKRLYPDEVLISRRKDEGKVALCTRTEFAMMADHVEETRVIKVFASEQDSPVRHTGDSRFLREYGRENFEVRRRRGDEGDVSLSNRWRGEEQVVRRVEPRAGREDRVQVVLRDDSYLRDRDFIARRSPELGDERLVRDRRYITQDEGPREDTRRYSVGDGRDERLVTDSRRVASAHQDKRITSSRLQGRFEADPRLQDRFEADPNDLRHNLALRRRTSKDGPMDARQRITDRRELDPRSLRLGLEIQVEKKDGKNLPDFSRRPGRFRFDEWKEKPEMIPKGLSYYEHDNRDDPAFRGGFRGRFRGRGRGFRGRGVWTRGVERDHEWLHDKFHEVDDEEDEKPSSTTEK